MQGSRHDTDSEIIKKLLAGEIKSGPKERYSLRSEIRKVIKDKFKGYEEFLFAEPPINPDAIGNVLNIQFIEDSLGEDVSAELRWGDGHFKYKGIINSDIPSEFHKRFSKFHECAHVMFNLLDDDFLARRTPAATTKKTGQYKDPAEIICDITASELLFYYEHFRKDIEGFDHKQSVCDQLAGISKKFMGSPEATLRSFIENYPGRAFMFVIREGYRKDEEREIAAHKESLFSFAYKKPVAMPRLAYGVVNHYMNFYLPQNKSFAKDTFIYKCFYERKSGCAEVELSSLGWPNCSGRFYVAVLPDESWSVGIGVEKK